MSDLRALIESGLVDKEDSTIFDTGTNLFWQQSPSNKTFTWEDANEHCRSLTLAGYNDWRLPTIDELKVLINKKYKPSIDPIFKCKSGWYWSSSTYVSNPNGAWYVTFNDGYVYGGYKGYDYFVRAVRG
jgi:hypothetical protein